MNRISALLLLIVSVAAGAEEQGLDTHYLQGLGDSRYFAIESDVIGRSYHIYVSLPESYDEQPDVDYPTVYLLDGGNLFPMLVVYYGYLNFAEEIPDAIIVGVSYGSDTFEGGNYRSTDYTAPSEERDYWGGAAKFQQFLKSELIPAIEQRYRSRPDRRIVFGQSLGGQFAIYSALTDPALFWGHIASNPALHRNLAFFLEPHWPEDGNRPTSRLFVASASNDDPVFRGPALEWIEHWSRADALPWRLHTMTLDGHSHMSAPPASFRAGMRWLFARLAPEVGR